MRYDQRVYFVNEGEDEYDYTTGDYVTTDPIKEEVWANVSDMSTQRQALVFGSVKQGALTIRIQNKYEQPFDYIEVGGQPYDVASSRTFRRDQAFGVSERL